MNPDGPREKLVEKGGGALSDREILCVLLGTGPRNPSGLSGISALALADTLLTRFGSLKGVVGAHASELESIRGIGRSKAALLLAVGDISLRLWKAQRGDESAPVLNSEQAYYLFSDLALEDQELVVAVFLNGANRVIGKRCIFRGTVDYSSARPREILREALRFNAVKLLVAHNHPSQRPEPSEEDVVFTSQLELAAEAVGIPLIDHVIVCGGGRYFSFAEAKLLEPRARELSRRRASQ